LKVGDRVALELRLADASTPMELESLIAKNKSLRAAWLELSERERRDAGEHIRAGKGQATRDRRAASIAEKLRHRGEIWRK
jgi:uncharacterized protein YdeI (YjbR/CyaY-like superfamily)